MKKRDNRTASEIEIHMGKAKTGVNITAPFMVDEYCCIICNAYFRKRIYESDLQVIEDLIQFFIYLASHNNAETLRKILQTTNNLKNATDNLHLENDFHQVLSDDLKVRLRDTHKTKPTKDSRVHDIPGEEYDDFYGKYARDLDTNWVRNSHRFNDLKIKNPSRILDIGCGFGLFSHIASFNGHIVDSIDMPDASPILKEASKILKINKYEFTIKANTPLLKFEHKFDFVTASQIFFNGHASKNLWDVGEWKFFLLDLHDNILNDNGRVTLVFNGEHKNLVPIMVDGEHVFLGKKSVELFFKPFFINQTNMPRIGSNMVAVLTKKNIKNACQSDVFKKQSYSLDLKEGNYGI